jgi:hypothetical protein
VNFRAPSLSHKTLGAPNNCGINNALPKKTKKEARKRRKRQVEANRRERHGAGKNVYGNMVTTDLKGSPKIAENPMVLGILWVTLNVFMGTWLQKIPKSSHCFANSVLLILNVHGNMVMNDFMVLGIL